MVSNSWVSKCSLKCGNKKLETSEGESCDDGARVDNDGWSTTCIKETGYTFSGDENQLTVATPIRGDQIRVPKEKWDDNNISDGKGCKEDWSCPLQGWYCSSISPNPSICNYVLMDGIQAINGEKCDDGNSVNNDGCSNSGTITQGYRFDLDIFNKQQFNYLIH